MMPRFSWRRAGLAAAAAVSTVVVMTSCSAGGSGNSSAIDLNSKAPTGVTLTVWHPASDPKYLLDLYSAYAKASGNKINLVNLPADTYPTAVQTKFAAGDRPDIMEYNPSPQDMAQLNATQNMLDLSSLAFVKNRNALGKTAGDLDGKTYAAVLGPLGINGLYINKKIFSDLGLTAPTNFADLLTTCKAIKASGKATPIFQGGGSEWPAMMLPGFDYMADYNANDQYGLSVASGKTKVSDPNGPIVAGLTAYANLRKAGCFNSNAATATQDDAIKAVYTGTAAMTPMSTDQISTFGALANNDAAKVEATVAYGPLSAKDGNTNFAPGTFGSFYVPKTGDTTKERAAADFIEWITSKGYQKYLDEAQSISTLTTAKTPALTGLAADAQKMVESGKATISFNEAIPGFGNFGALSVKVLVGQSTPQQAAAQWQTFIDQAISAQKQ